MRAKLELGRQRPRKDPHGIVHARRPYQAPRLLEFDEDLRRRCARVFEDLAHLLHCLKCEDTQRPPQVENPRLGNRHYDPHYWG